MTSSELDWASALDLFEASLTHHSTLLVDSEVDGDNPWPDSGLPTTPIPDELRPRAERLLRESYGIMDDMAGALSALPPRRSHRPSRRETPDQPRWTMEL